MSKRSFLLLALALVWCGRDAHAQSLIGSWWLTCPVNPANQVVVFLPGSGSRSLGSCAVLDPSFVVDRSTTPPTIRVAQPAPQTVFVDVETPGGTQDGVNGVFTLAAPPNPPSSVRLVIGAATVKFGLDFMVNGATITFQPGAILPRAGEVFWASYRK